MLDTEYPVNGRVTRTARISSTSKDAQQNTKQSKAKELMPWQ
jgi:hypothetical protein